MFQINEKGSSARGTKCYRCGNPDHLATKCRFKESVCHQCGKTGHLAKVCRSKSSSQKPPVRAGKPRKYSENPVHRVEEEYEDSEEDNPIHQIHTVNGSRSLPPIKVQIGVDDCLVNMEVDTGASMSIMAETTYRRLWPQGVG